MKRHVAVLVALTILMTGSLAFAGGRQEVSDVTTITWGYWGSPEEVAQNRRVAEMFEAANPDIRIEHMHAPWGDYFTQLQIQFAGGDAPDVMFLTNMTQYMPLGVLKDLRPLFAEHGFNTDAYSAEMIEQFSYQGGVFGVPRDNDTMVVYYNRDLFEAAGIDPPSSAGWTTEEFVNAAIALTGTTGGGQQYGLAYDPRHWDRWGRKNGAQFFDDPRNPTRVTLDDPNLMVALEFLYDLKNTHRVTPPFDALSSTDQRIQLFASGRLGMLVDNHARIPEFVSIDRFSWDVAPTPQFPGRGPANNAGGAGYTINAATANVEAAWRLWEFLNTDGMAGFIEAGRGTVVPANFDVLESDAFLTNQPWNQQVFVEETKVGISPPPNIYWFSMLGTAHPFLESAWVGDSSVQAAVERAMPEVNQLLD